MSQDEQKEEKPVKYVPRWFPILVLLIAITFPNFAKLTSIITLLALSASILVGLIKRSTGADRFFFVLCLLWISSIVAPVDIAFRRGTGFNVRWVSVFCAHYGTPSTISERLAKSGLKENFDYVIYDSSCAEAPKWAVLFIIPPGSS